MKITLFSITACCCIAMCLGEPKPAINEIKNTVKSGNGDPKGRFLTLPVPSKCSSRKYNLSFLLFY